MDVKHPGVVCVAIERGGRDMTAKKPKGLRTKRVKRKLIPLKRTHLKDNAWYAAAAVKIGIASRADRAKDSYIDRSAGD